MITTKKKDVNHAGTENTDAKQKEVSHFRKKSFTQRRGDAKKKKFLSSLNRQFEF